jgi:hypothetical protein
LGCFAVGFVNGWTSYVAFLHNIPLNRVVEFFDPGSNADKGNIPIEYLSTLLLYSGLGLLGGMASLIIWRLQNRRMSVSR